jgi:anti-sigma factor RsiW
MTACPSDDELIAFALGELGDTQTGPVRAHLASCEPCGCAVAEVVRAIATGDSASIDTQPPEPRGPELQGGEFLGRYQVIERLGRGAMGTVYVARDPELNRRVAIKVLTPGAVGAIGRDQLQARLLREAQAMAQLSHPNVVAVHDVGSTLRSGSEGGDVSRLKLQPCQKWVGDFCNEPGSLRIERACPSGWWSRR